MISTPESIPEFGERIASARYVLRPGGYAIIGRASGEIAIVETARGWHLPGGGQGPGETAEQAAVRETSEECGLQIRIIELLGVADQLVYSAKDFTHYRKRCWFFRAALLASEPSGGGEADHRLLWVRRDERALRLAHESHRWIVATNAA